MITKILELITKTKNLNKEQDKSIETPRELRSNFSFSNYICGSIAALLCLYLILNLQLSGLYYISDSSPILEKIGLEGILALCVGLILILNFLNRFLDYLNGSLLHKILIYSLYVYPIQQTYKLISYIYVGIELKQKDFIELHFFGKEIKIFRNWSSEELYQMYQIILNDVKLMIDEKFIGKLQSKDIIISFEEKENLIANSKTVAELKEGINNMMCNKASEILLTLTKDDSTYFTNYIKPLFGIIYDYKWYILGGICVIGLCATMNNMFSTVGKSLEKSPQNIDLLNNNMETHSVTNNIVNSINNNISELGRSTQDLTGVMQQNISLAQTQNSEVLDHLKKSTEFLLNRLGSIAQELKNLGETLAVLTEQSNKHTTLLVKLLHILVEGEASSENQIAYIKKGINYIATKLLSEEGK